jgi:hypothetical protein
MKSLIVALSAALLTTLAQAQSEPVPPATAPVPMAHADMAGPAVKSGKAAKSHKAAGKTSKAKKSKHAAKKSGSKKPAQHASSGKQGSKKVAQAGKGKKAKRHAAA